MAIRTNMMSRSREDNCRFHLCTIQSDHTAVQATLGKSLQIEIGDQDQIVIIKYININLDTITT